MKLFYTPNSPYARIARIASLELNLSEQIEMQKVTVRVPNSELLNYNPTGKVPTQMLLCEFCFQMHNIYFLSHAETQRCRE
ncbi:glutathione S-transferase N-terminal domain-containing protein [Nostoc sp.]